MASHREGSAVVGHVKKGGKLHWICQLCRRDLQSCYGGRGLACPAFCQLSHPSKIEEMAVAPVLLSGSNLPCGRLAVVQEGGQRHLPAAVPVAVHAGAVGAVCY